MDATTSLPGGSMKFLKHNGIVTRRAAILSAGMFGLSTACDRIPRLRPNTVSSWMEVSFRPSPLVLRPIPLAASRELVGSQSVFERAMLDHGQELIEVQELLHALRLFKSCTSDSSVPIGGKEGGFWVNLLLNSKLLDQYYSSMGLRLLVPTESGFRVNTLGGKYGRATQPHYDKLFQVMAECGISASRMVSLGGRQLELRDGLRESLGAFTVQSEIEFSSVAFAYYVPLSSMWRNRHGEVMSFSTVARVLLQQPDGACYNIHRLYALAVLLRVSEMYGGIDESLVSAIRKELWCVSQSLSGKYNDSRQWAAEWIGSLREGMPFPDLAEITVTGHHLEWMSMVRPELRPADDILSHVAQSMTRNVQHYPNEMFRSRYGPISHADAALRNLFPSEWNAFARRKAITGEKA